MTDIGPKALEHACQCAGRSVHHFDRMALDLPLRASIIAHARAIEQHEAYKREVSDAVEAVFTGYHDAPIPWVVMRRKLEPFILPKPDPLVEALQEWGECEYGPVEAESFRAAIKARGGRIVWEGE